MRGSIDDRRRALRRVRFADLGQHLLGLLPGSPGRGSAGCLRRPRPRFTVSSRIGSPSASLTTRRSPSVPAEHRSSPCLEPGQALVFGADRADHLARHLALRVDAAAVGQLRRSLPGRAVRSSPRSVSVDLVGDVGEAAILRSGLRALRPASRSRIAADLLRRLRRVLHLVGRREDRRRVLGDGELRCRCGRASLPRRPGHRRPSRSAGRSPRTRAAAPCTPCSQKARATTTQEAEEEAGEEQPDPALDQAHRALLVPAAARRWRRRGDDVGADRRSRSALRRSASPGPASAASWRDLLAAELCASRLARIEFSCSSVGDALVDLARRRRRS